MIDDYIIDSNSLNIIKNYNYKKLKLNSITNYYKWEKFAIDKGMKPVFNKINDGKLFFLIQSLPIEVLKIEEGFSK